MAHHFILGVRDLELGRGETRSVACVSFHFGWTLLPHPEVVMEEEVYENDMSCLGDLEHMPAELLGKSSLQTVKNVSQGCYLPLMNR